MLKIKDNAELKKQLEEYKNSQSCSFVNICKNVKIANYNQQKEFISYLEDEINKLKEQIKEMLRMNKLNVGDYVRTDKGEIGKLEELKLNYTKGKRLVTYYTYKEVEENYIMFDNKNITQRFVDGSCYYLTDDELKSVEKSIVKSSPNIIDLIEVGDYVNGYLVIERDINNELRYIDLKDRNMKYVKNLDIKSIVTKEQFSQMEYKVNKND